MKNFALMLKCQENFLFWNFVVDAYNFCLKCYIIKYACIVDYSNAISNILMEKKIKNKIK